MKKIALALNLSVVLLVSLIIGVHIVEVVNANFFPGDNLFIFSPVHKRVYANTSVPLNIVAVVANPTPEVASITYCLDDYPNVTLTDLNKTLREPGHIDGSSFYADLVLENLAEGNHTIKVYSQDSAGNQMFMWSDFIIDTSYTSPLSVLSPQNKTYTITEVPLTFICREDRTHDGKFSRAAYVLDGMGSDYINENVTLTDLSLSYHTIHVTVWTENDYFSENIHFTIEEPEPFPATLVITALVIIAVVCIGSVVYFKTFRSEAKPS